MISRLVLGAVVLVLVSTGCGRSDHWPEQVTSPLAQGGPPSPAFPAALHGWERTQTWRGLPRAFTGDSWTPASGPDDQAFPSTMNGCDDQRFLVRWRAVSAGVQVEARYAGVMGASPGPPVRASAGWMDLDGCDTPEFRLPVVRGGESSLVDVTVQVQRYEPVP